VRTAIKSSGENQSDWLRNALLKVARGK